MKKILTFVLMMIMVVTAFSKEVSKSANDYEKIRVKWGEFLTGVTSEDDLSSSEVQKVVETNEKNAEKSYTQINKEKNKRYFLDEKEDMKSGIQILNSYNAIKNIAKGYATRGTKFYKNEEVKNQIIAGMDWLYDNAYHEGLPEIGNWWHWELGIPKAVNDILILMNGDIPKEKVEKYLRATKFFQPDARYSGAGATASYSSTPDKRVSTGGNRTDTAMISFLRGVLLEDKVEVKNALEAVTEVGEYATKGDGFYKDGSFIQHNNVAYNGTYASVLFNGLGGILYLVKDTEFEIKSKKLDNIYEAILNGYGYLFINGGMNDSVSGRAISRNKTSDLSRGRDVINSLAMLSEGASDEYRVRLQELIKTNIFSNNSFNILEMSGNRTILGILRDIVEDESIKTRNIVGNKMFHSMDRAISKNKNGGAVALSMHSSRIANFETMNGENLRGWFTGDGMTYIYGNDSSAYTEFWPTVDMYHLPGVTNSLKVRGDRSGERRGITTPKAWVGGVNNGEIFIGMDMLSWNKALKVKKSYLFTEDGVVAVYGDSLSSNEGEIHTTIDNRILKSGKLIVNGKEITESTVIENPKDMTIMFVGNYPEETIGYRIIDAPKVEIKFEERKGNWKSIGGTDSKEIVKKYVTIYINHGKNPKDQKFSYLIFPMFKEEEVKNYNLNSLKLVQSDEKIHAVEDNENRVVRINFWKDLPVKFRNIRSFSTASMIVKEDNNELLIAVSEPTQLMKKGSIFEIDGAYELEESSSKDIKVTNRNNLTRVEIDLRNNGATEIIKLKKVK
ncbi:polysaccharide lyase 8 family protein [uncultured Fusobacterium sp.]|uniref:polysaccharide lyase 8 family protein n=1 Tax=uncultured Fusobacterium sp. TaxID=159267 RepID=UPI0025E5C0F2|nr:polysaccharide lyase 8 family protein [uncultured Fusobacterium sp.]